MSLSFIELYEGLKLAQRGRLEDQRGTEIKFEMPDFLKREQQVRYKLVKTSNAIGDPPPLLKKYPKLPWRITNDKFLYYRIKSFNFTRFLKEVIKEATE